MGKFNISPEQKEELKHGDSTTPVLIDEAAGQGRGTYHNPVTGQELRNARMDNWHMWLRLRQGWQLGPASPELREKWKIREAELRAEDDAMEEKHLSSQEHVDSERARFNDAVTAAAEVAAKAILEKLGIDLPGKSGAEVEAASPAAAPAPEGEQLAFNLPEDAPSESETKLVVSQASRPELHLVGQERE
jgi:hypothetical protein